jgi:chemotaxis signal transduction protein
MFQPHSASSVAESMHASGTAESKKQRMMLLSAGNHLFALPLESVREILPAKSYTPLPGTAKSVCGLINVRGRIVTVIDLSARMRLVPASTDPEHSVVLLDFENRHIGFAVGEILRIMDIDPAALGDSADALRLLGLDRNYVLGVGEVDGQMYVALDPAEVVRPLFA